MRRLVLASGNAKKQVELAALVGPLGFEVVNQTALGIEDAEEPYATFVENALTKARHAASRAQSPALADDSGLCVPALGNRPGVLSARYAGEPRSDARNNARLIADLKGLGPSADWSAYYVCVLVWVDDAVDPEPLIAAARWHGRIIEHPRGQNGFGYDAHFLLPDLGRTAAELEPDQKNALSHRAQALLKLRADLMDAGKASRGDPESGR